MTTSPARRRREAKRARAAEAGTRASRGRASAAAPAAARGKAKFEHSAGGVVVRAVGGEVEVALAARRTQRGTLAWGLPKGGIEPGEGIREAAVREVREETGLEAVVRRPLGDIRYRYVWDAVRISKRVTFFLMDATGGDVADHDHEMEEVRWFPLQSALRRASYRGEREVLRRAASALGGTGSPAKG